MSRSLPIIMATLLLQALPAHAQSPTSLASSLSLYSSYEARGLTFTDGIVGQATAELAFTRRGTSLAAGAWANMEPPLSGAARRRMLPADVGGPSEINLFASVARDFGSAEVELGTIHFLFPHGFDFSAPDLLVELYARVQLPAPGAPALTALYDMTARGWYAQLQTRQEHAFGGGFASITAELGASLGQSDAGEYYAADGITHASTILALSWSAGGVSIGPDVRWTYAIDPATRPGGALRVGRMKGTAGITASWSPAY